MRRGFSCRRRSRKTVLRRWVAKIFACACKIKPNEYKLSDRRGRKLFLNLPRIGFRSSFRFRWSSLIDRLGWHHWCRANGDYAECSLPFEHFSSWPGVVQVVPSTMDAVQACQGPRQDWLLCMSTSQLAQCTVVREARTDWDVRQPHVDRKLCSWTAAQATFEFSAAPPQPTQRVRARARTALPSLREGFSPGFFSLIKGSQTFRYAPERQALSSFLFFFLFLWRSWRMPTRTEHAESVHLA